MDVCERTSHHDPTSTAWRDKFFVDCATALMDPRVAIAVGEQSWLPQLLNCVVQRLNNDVPPLLPGREAASALQCLAAVARSPAARPAVKSAIMNLGARADELFHDKLQGLRSFNGVDGDSATGSISGKSLVHNAFVLSLIRCEGYQLSAAALLELVDQDVAALISILLAICKITTYELGVTANCLACVFALTTPATYFSAESNGGHEVSLASFAAKLVLLLKEWEAANVLDALLPLLHRRCQLWATAVRTSTTSGSPKIANSAGFSTPAEQREEPRQIAACVSYLSRTLINLGAYIPDARATTAIRQHVLVVQNAARPFTGILASLASVLEANTTAETRLDAMDALSSALEMFNVASRDVVRVPQALREGIVAPLRVVWTSPRTAAGLDSSPLVVRLLFASVVALINAQCVLDASSLEDSSDDAEKWSGEVTEAVASRLGSITPASGRPWVALLAAQPQLNRAKFEAAFYIFEAYVGNDIDAALKDLDGQAAAIEREMENLATARDELRTQVALEHQQHQMETRSGGEVDSPPKPPHHDGPSLLGDLPPVSNKLRRRDNTSAAIQPAVANSDSSLRARKLMAAVSSAPPEFLCALYGTLMADPVKLPSGRYVDLAALEAVIADMGHVDPISAKALPNDYVPTVDTELKTRIVEFRFQSEIQQHNPRRP